MNSSGVRSNRRKFNSGQLYKKDLFLKELFNIIPEANIVGYDQFTTNRLQVETNIKSDQLQHDTMTKIMKIGGKISYCNEILWINFDVPSAFPLFVTAGALIMYSLSSLTLVYLYGPEMILFLQSFLT